MTDSLHSVGVENNALFMAELSDFRYRLNCTDFVICVHYRNKCGVLTDSVFNILNFNYTVLVDGKICDFAAVELFASLNRMKHGMVLKSGCDNMLFALFRHSLGNTLNCPVVSLAAARGKINLVGVGIDDLCNSLPRILNAVMSLLTYVIKA